MLWHFWFTVPLEYLTLFMEMKFMLLLSDVRQGIFYAMLCSFWLVFAGEHMLIQESGEKNSLKIYWRHLIAVVVGCVSLFLFDICERGVQLRNPFYSIWVSRFGSKIAVSENFLTSKLTFIKIVHRRRSLCLERCQLQFTSSSCATWSGKYSKTSASSEVSYHRWVSSDDFTTKESFTDSSSWCLLLFSALSWPLSVSFSDKSVNPDGSGMTTLSWNSLQLFSQVFTECGTFISSPSSFFTLQATRSGRQTRLKRTSWARKSSLTAYRPTTTQAKFPPWRSSLAKQHSTKRFAHAMNFKSSPLWLYFYNTTI